MFRRFFVSVLVAAMTFVVTPRPSFGLGDDHFRCMYRCKERRYHKPAPKARLDPPVRPLRHYTPGGWGHGGWGSRPHWSGPHWTGGHRPHRPWGWHPDWFDNGDDDRWHLRPRRWHRWHRWDRWQRWHRWNRGHDPSRDSGYNHHRHHPRGRDF